jgi:hypothetical protein
MQFVFVELRHWASSQSIEGGQFPANGLAAQERRRSG